MLLYCTLWHGLAQSATRPQGGSRFVFEAGCTLSVRPRESGDPEAKHTAKHFGLSKSGPPLPRGRTVIVARPELACSVAKEPLRAEQDSKQRRSAPVCMLRAGGRPHSSVLTSLASRGMARRQGAMPGLLQADVRQRPDHDAQLCVHPRLAARQRAFSAYASSTFGPARSYLSLGGFSERRPWVGLRDRRPAGALPLPALQTPPEGAPRTRNGMGST